ncbi:MAG: hypothetical protein KAS11_05395 [Candidatus Aenigmarchaeota archaeon]|nr:hypothetical protein [Candidatus Aenigmarchaeota archaeon]
MASPDKIKIKDYVLSPVEKIWITYKGQKPLSIVKQAENIMKIGVDVSASALFNMIFKYDTTDGSFYNKLYATRGFDKFTKALFYVEFDGGQNLETGDGNIRITLYAILETEFPYANSWQRSMWWSYYHMFYRIYRSRCRIAAEKYVYKLRDTFMQISGITAPEMQ